MSSIKKTEVSRGPTDELGKEDRRHQTLRRERDPEEGLIALRARSRIRADYWFGSSRCTGKACMYSSKTSFMCSRVIPKSPSRS